MAVSKEKDEIKGVPCEGDIAIQIEKDSDNTEINSEAYDTSAQTASERFRTLLNGKGAAGDSGQPMTPPEWLDRDLFDNGRAFYKKYFFCIYFASVLSLLYLFATERFIRPLIFTGRSDTKEKSFRRYLSTLTHLKAWYEGDVWDPDDAAHKDIKGVRAIHKKVANHINSQEHCAKEKFDVRTRGHEEPSCPMYKIVCKDLQSKMQDVTLPDPEPVIYISQWDMACTQYTFMGIMVSHPHRMGAWNVKDEELEALIHFWRGIGWLLGIDDEFNFCNGNLEETRSLCRDVERFVVIPGLAKSNWNYEHMSQCLIEGLNMMVPFLSFPAMLLFAAEVVGVDLPSLETAMSRKEKFQYRLLRFNFGVFCNVPGSLWILNPLLHCAIKYGRGKFPLWFYKMTSLFTSVDPLNFKNES